MTPPPQGNLFGEVRYQVPERYRETLRIGTCSWKYDSWKGLVYDRGRKYLADDFLVDYSRHFDTVEVDQWFWSLFPGEIAMPKPETVAAYAVSVPGDFVFSVKAPNAITLTHFYSKQPAQFRGWKNRPNPHFLSVELAQRFLDSLEPIRSRLGPVMFQFEYLNSKKMASRDMFYDRLDGFLSRLPAGYEYAVETRNPNYVRPEFFEILRGHNAGAVLLDGYHMPPLRKVARHGVHTAPFLVIRLHGPDRPGIERRTGKRWNRIVQPRDRGLEEAAEIVNEAAKKNVRTYVNVNNHYEGSAPLTIERFLEALRRERPEE